MPDTIVITRGIQGPSGSTISGSASGDLSNSYPNPTVVKIQGRAVSASAPSTGNSLLWNGSAWAPGTPTVTTVSGITVSGTPSTGQVLTATSSSTADWADPTGSSFVESTIVYVDDPVYGVPQDGTSDCSLAIQALFDSLGAEDYVRVQFGAQRYMLSRPIRVIGEHKHLYGYGTATSFAYLAGLGGPAFFIGVKNTGVASELGAQFVTAEGPSWPLSGGVNSNELMLRDTGMLEFYYRGAEAAFGPAPSWTIECAVKFSTVGEGIGKYILSSGGSPGQSRTRQHQCFQLLKDASDKLAVRVALTPNTWTFPAVFGEITNITRYDLAASAACVTNTVYKVAVVYDGSTLAFYVNGTRQGTWSVSGYLAQQWWEEWTIGWSQQTGFMGADHTNFGPADGWISRIRFSKTARYSGSTYTPPATLSADSDTLLLVRFDNIVGAFGVPDILLCDSPGLSATGTGSTVALPICNYGVASAGSVPFAQDMVIRDMYFSGSPDEGTTHPGVAGIFRQRCTSGSDASNITFFNTHYGLYDRNNCYTNKVSRLNGVLSATARWGYGNAIDGFDQQVEDVNIRGGAFNLAFQGGAQVRVIDGYLLNCLAFGIVTESTGINVKGIHQSSEAGSQQIVAGASFNGDVFSGTRLLDCEFGPSEAGGAATQVPAVMINGGKSASFVACYLAAGTDAACDVAVYAKPDNGLTFVGCTQLYDTHPLSDAMDIATVTDGNGVAVGGVLTSTVQQEAVAAPTTGVSTAADLTALTAKFNSLRTMLSNAGIMAAAEFDFTSIANLHADWDDRHGISTSGGGTVLDSWTDQVTSLVATSGGTAVAYSATGGPDGAALITSVAGSYMSCSSNLVTVGSARTIFVLAKPSNGASGFLVSAKNHSGQTQNAVGWYNYYSDLTLPVYYYTGPTLGTLAASDGAGVLGSTWQVFTFQTVVGAQPLARINGRRLVNQSPCTVVTESAGTAGFDILGDSLVASSGWAGSVRRILVYSRALTMAEIQQAERALMRQLLIRDTGRP